MPNWEGFEHTRKGRVVYNRKRHPFTWNRFPYIAMGIDDIDFNRHITPIKTGCAVALHQLFASIWMNIPDYWSEDVQQQEIFRRQNEYGDMMLAIIRDSPEQLEVSLRQIFLRIFRTIYDQIPEPIEGIKDWVWPIFEWIFQNLHSIIPYLQ